MASQMTDPEGTAAMLEVAERYDRLVVRALQRLSETAGAASKNEAWSSDSR